LPIQRIVLAGGAKSYGFHLGHSMLPRRRGSHVSLRRSTTTSRKTLWPSGPPRTELAGLSCVRIWSWDQA
jgi:hypothetical protein